ncbi:hypothetical protein H9P43_009082 [Blastocladiella emersonii ATCC 22665]|nr:hypothetical protein H9P43_009082 [Blastocladiella emersonii ATCC 22665]
MQRLPYEVVEMILLWAIRVDPRGIDPWPLILVSRDGASRVTAAALGCEQPPVDWSEAHFYLSLLCAGGRADLFVDWLRLGHMAPNSPDYMDLASMHGQTEIIKLLTIVCSPLLYTERAVDEAARAGEIATLEWWRN